MNNFLEHLIHSYLSESKEYCHQGVNFYLSKFNCIDHISVFYINVKMKLVQTFLTPQKGFIKTLQVTALHIVKIM